MKTSLLLLLFLLSTCSSGYSQDIDIPLKVGYFDFPGLTYTDVNGKPAGFVNDITIKVLENTNLKYTIERYPAARFYEYLSDGKINIFNGLSSIPSVHSSCVSSKTPLFPLEMRVYHTSDKKVITKKEDLISHSVILVRGFTYKDWGAWIRDPNNKVIFYETDSHKAAFEMLKRGRAEYLLNYKYIDEEVLQSTKIPDLVIKSLFIWYCYFNINKDTPNAESILKQLESSYEELLQAGKLRKFE